MQRDDAAERQNKDQAELDPGMRAENTWERAFDDHEREQNLGRGEGFARDRAHPDETKALVPSRNPLSYPQGLEVAGWIVLIKR